MGIVDAGQPVADARVHFEFFQVDGQTATKRSEADSSYRALDARKGIYVARTRFESAGAWGVQVNISRPDRPIASARTSFQVLPEGHAPTPGQRAVASRSLTASDVANLADICSAQPPCDMHAVSIQDALALSKPLLIAFSTPGYCTTQTCGPVLTEVGKVKQGRAEQASFVHVEIYKDPRNLVVADAVAEWDLQSEPWVFFVDRAGVIADRFEGIATADEIDQALAALI
jgi:hypothetical protein